MATKDELVPHVYKSMALDLRRLLDSMAPTPEAKLYIDKYYSELVRRETPHEQCVRLTSALYDGLAYGNWLWYSGYTVGAVEKQNG